MSEKLEERVEELEEMVKLLIKELAYDKTLPDKLKDYMRRERW